MPVGRTKKGKTKAQEKKTKPGRPYKVKSETGDISVIKKSVQDARAKKGVFKERPAYKGKTHKNKSGEVSGYTSHSGKYTRTSTPLQRKKAKKAQDYDRKLHKADSTSHSRTIRRFATAKRKKS